MKFLRPLILCCVLMNAGCQTFVMDTYSIRDPKDKCLFYVQASRAPFQQRGHAEKAWQEKVDKIVATYGYTGYKVIEYKRQEIGVVGLVAVRADGTSGGVPGGGEIITSRIRCY